MASLNTEVHDLDSVVTGYGAHNRVVVFSLENNQCYCRIDALYDLPTPTEQDIIKVMKNGLEQIKGRWTIVKRTMWGNEKHEDIYLEKQ